MQAVNWMRSMWAQGKHSLLADEMGLGKTASVITFIQCLRYALVLWGAIASPCPVFCYLLVKMPFFVLPACQEQLVSSRHFKDLPAELWLAQQLGTGT